MNSFLLENSLAFLRHHRKTNMLIILSMAASLLPLYMALANIQVFGVFLQSMRIPNAENVSILSTVDAEEAVSIYTTGQYPISLKQYAKTDLFYNDSWQKVTVIYVDEEIGNYENFTVVGSVADRNRNPLFPACAVEKNLLKYYDWRVGDVIKISGKEYQITTIIRSAYNLQSILLPQSEIKDVDAIYHYQLYVRSADAPNVSQVKESPTLTMQKAVDVSRSEITNGILQSAGTLLIGSVLLLFAVANISTIFIGEFEGTRESIGIRRLLGAEMRHIRQVIELKNLILIGISDGIVYVLSPILSKGTNIDFQYTLGTILVHALLSGLVAHILTSIVMGRMRKTTLIAFLKKEN